jgi:hypothetical protein
MIAEKKTPGPFPALINANASARGDWRPPGGMPIHAQAHTIKGPPVILPINAERRRQVSRTAANSGWIMGIPTPRHAGDPLEWFGGPNQYRRRKTGLFSYKV